MSDLPETVSREALVTREMADAVNPISLLSDHVSSNTIDGIIVTRTRFPPEPNGYLHIGHAKSMNANFSLAFEKLNVKPEARRTIFRYDDTNPDAESTEYIDSIRRDLEYMGWKPERTTFSSDSFQVLYDFACKLIDRGLAYVDDMTKAQVEEQRALALRRAISRGNGLDPDVEHPLDPALIPGPNRNTSPERNRRLFEGMRAGKYPEGSYTLRMKMDFDSPNPNMYDHMAYRIKYTPHPHAGNAWCVYPTYDFTHAICDSLEHIDYSICTLEFENRRESYYWLLAALDLYRPKIYEMSRLNLTYTVLSKRRLLKLVGNGHVRGWNDPRMPTISGLRRRGYTAQIINDFCARCGVSRASCTIEAERLAGVAREHLAPTCRRAMACYDPVEVLITNFAELTGSNIFTVLDVATELEGKSHTVELTETIYITARDFRVDGESDRNYYGLKPGGSVGLKYFGGNLTCEKFEKKVGGGVKLFCTADNSEGRKKPKSHVSWCPSSSLPCEIRIYDNLFLTPKPTDLWEEELNPENEIVYKDALVDPSVVEDGMCGTKGEEGKWISGNSFQFERLGYFVVDIDTTYDSASGKGKIVFNRIVSLREDEGKKNVSNTAESAAVKVAQEEKTKKQDARREEQKRQVEAKAARLKISPQNLFREAQEHAGKFSIFDVITGLPTHDSNGKELTKSALKKLAKEQKKHEMVLKKAAVVAARGG
mmetsp:Transcript_24231/g.55165  ORF Transcript_24231/g.55165 Transcript_24231/m.55165 type:complete len:711 (-) Transcript_24231:264-2396(-)